MIVRPRRPYRVIVADPPWRFGDNLPGPGRGAAKHYGTLSVPELCTLRTVSPLRWASKNAVLFLWRVGAMQREALDVATYWGFGEPISEVVWIKTTAAGRPRMGMGRTVRNAHEICLIFRRGRVPRKSAAVLSTIHAPRGEHSAKPEAFYRLVRRLYPGPRLELFARQRRPGFDAWGDEV